MTFFIKYMISVGLFLLIVGTILALMTNWSLWTSLPASTGLGWAILGVMTKEDRAEIFS